MNYMKLLKLLHIAERKSLRVNGRMITSDRVAALERGPILSTVLDLIKGTSNAVRIWDRHIERERNHVSLKSKPGVDSLTRYEIELLQDVARQYRDNDEWEMVEITHRFEEWIKNRPDAGSSNWIPVYDILVGAGVTDPEAALVEAAQQAKLDDFFARHGACNNAIPSSLPSQATN